MCRTAIIRSMFIHVDGYMHQVKRKLRGGPHRQLGRKRLKTSSPTLHVASMQGALVRKVNEIMSSKRLLKPKKGFCWELGRERKVNWSRTGLIKVGMSLLNLKKSMIKKNVIMIAWILPYRSHDGQLIRLNVTCEYTWCWCYLSHSCPCWWFWGKITVFFPFLSSGLCRRHGNIVPRKVKRSVEKENDGLYIGYGLVMTYEWWNIYLV